jgi:kynurenine formamidase
MKMYDLAYTLDATLPSGALHVPFRMALTMRHGDMVRADGGSAAQEMLSLGGHIGTHLDALAHASLDGRLYGGVDAEEASRGGWFKVLGIETVPPRISRGILLDPTCFYDHEPLPAGLGITSDLLARTATEERVQVCPDDAVFVRTGWPDRCLGDREAFLGLQTGVPGIDVSGAQYLLDGGATLIGADTLAVEQILPLIGHSSLPVHSLLLVSAGVHILEMLDLASLANDRQWEFLLVLIPLKLRGATASPVRPLALVDSA